MELPALVFVRSIKRVKVGGGIWKIKTLKITNSLLGYV